MMETRPRPNYHSEEVEAAAVEKLLPEVLEWLKNGNGEQESVAVRRDLLDVFDPFEDGYGLCSKLERYKHWDCDSELVGILDNLSWRHSDALREAEQRWVEETGQKPAKQVGDACTFSQRGASYVGEVTTIHPYGYYVVYCEALGHVRSGIGTHGTYVRWEEAA